MDSKQYDSYLRYRCFRISRTASIPLSDRMEIESTTASGCILHRGENERPSVLLRLDDLELGRQEFLGPC